MSFLMGLNESFSQIRGQLLLLDPIPSIHKVFYFISQEERQRTISSQFDSAHRDSVSNMAFAIRAGHVKATSSVNQFGSYKPYVNTGAS